MNITELIGESTVYDKKQMLEIKKPKSWCKSVSTFANGIGGLLIFGITEENIAVGLENAENDAEIISEQIKPNLPNYYTQHLMRTIFNPLCLLGFIVKTPLQTCV